MSPGSTTTPSAAMTSSSVVAVDRPPLVAEVVGEVDEHAAALHAVERHVLQPEVVGEGAVPAAVAARRRRAGPTRSVPAR